MYGINTLPYYTNSSMTPYGYASGGIASLRPGYGIGGKIKKAFKSVTKPVAKVLDKIVPNEIKPALPFIAAAVPFFGPALAASTLGMTAAQYAAIAPYIQAGASAFSQLSQEGAAERGLNPVSLGLSALQGYLAAPGAADSLSAGKIIGNVGDTAITAGDFATQFPGYTGPKTFEALSQMSDVATTGPTFLQGTENLARSVGSIGAETLGTGRESFENIISGSSANLGKDFINVGKAYVPGALQASGELAYNAALDAQKAYQNELLAMGNLASANKQDQINYIRRAMVSAGFNEDEISSAISRSGFMYGGNVEEGGLMNLRIGDMPAEMDLRKGGFVPLGKKERADDVPARLSKNEFVFTAKAVRNAGGGDVRKGAKRMYQIMNQLEARA
jgi:alkylhydroperoxidase/carboxymuconolactone decarboxylase family protein YurZ